MMIYGFFCIVYPKPKKNNLIWDIVISGMGLAFLVIGFIISIH